MSRSNRQWVLVAWAFCLCTGAFAQQKMHLFMLAGQFPAKPWNNSRRQVNAAHLSIAEQMPFVVFVSSDGLTPNSDNIHFNAESQREFGRRFAKKYISMLRGSE